MSISNELIRSKNLCEFNAFTPPMITYISCLVPLHNFIHSQSHTEAILFIFHRLFFVFKSSVYSGKRIPSKARHRIEREKRRRQRGAKIADENIFSDYFQCRISLILCHLENDVFRWLSMGI